MAWIQITINIDDVTQVETLENLLTQNQALSITIEDNADEPLFEQKLREMPIWQHSKVTALFEENIDPDKIKKLLAKQFGNDVLNNIIVEHVADQNWQELCQKSFPTLNFGNKLCVCPSWDIAPQNVEVVVKLDPGMAFGTGTHQTTHLCLEWLVDNVTANDTIIDYGCGSGILAIAALKLGAKRSIAIDYDNQALYSTNKNAELNNLSDNDIQCLLPAEVPENIKANIVVANILANPLCELRETLASLVSENGKLVLSGILDTQIELILHAYNNYFNHHKIALKDEWVRIEFYR